MFRSIFQQHRRYYKIIFSVIALLIGLAVLDRSSVVVGGMTVLLFFIAPIFLITPLIADSFANPEKYK